MAKPLAITILSVLFLSLIPFTIKGIESPDYILDSYSFGNFADEELESSDYGILVNNSLFNGEIESQTSQNSGNNSNTNTNSGLQFVSVGSTNPVSYTTPISYTNTNDSAKPSTNTSSDKGGTTNSSDSNLQDQSSVLGFLTSWYCIIPVLILLLLILLFLLTKRKEEK